MTTKFNSHNSPLKKSTFNYTFQEIKKKAVETKKDPLNKTYNKKEIKTSTFLQIPSIDFSIFNQNQRLTPRQIKTSRSPVKRTNPQKHGDLFNKLGKIPKERLKTMSTIEDSDRNKYLTMLKDFMSPSTVVLKKSNGKMEKFSSSIHVKAVSNNFLESFKIVLNELIESYFIQICMKNKISHLKIELWNYIFKKAGVQFGDQKRKLHYQQIDKKKFSLGIQNIFQDEFNSSQVENMVIKYFSNQSIIFYSQLEGILTPEKDYIDALVERAYELQYASLGPSQMVKLFLKNMIQFADLQKKLQMICGANENQVIKFVYSISVGNVLEVEKFSKFLEQKDKFVKEKTFGLKLEEVKLINFLDKVLKEKLTKFQLIKWLRLHEKLIH